jgi:hypothetical protein
MKRVDGTTRKGLESKQRTNPEDSTPLDGLPCKNLDYSNKFILAPLTDPKIGCHIVRRFILFFLALVAFLLALLAALVMWWCDGVMV